jgi:hypothetical protein
MDSSKKVAGHESPDWRAPKLKGVGVLQYSQGDRICIGINPDTFGCRDHFLDMLSFRNPHRMERINKACGHSDLSDQRRLTMSHYGYIYRYRRSFTQLAA